MDSYDSEKMTEEEKLDEQHLRHYAHSYGVMLHLTLDQIIANIGSVMEYWTMNEVLST